MRGTGRRVAKDWLPPWVSDLLAPRLGRAVRYAGPYPSWAAAGEVATGYDAEVIADRCLSAALAVRSGAALFERDTVLHHDQDLGLPAVVAALLLARQSTVGELRVLDFGGSLASLYYRCRPWWSVIGPMRWLVVEQPGLVARGNAHLADESLGFVDSIDAAIAALGRPAVVVASSVLPYVEHPQRVLADLVELGADVVCLDRTQTADDGVERVFVQHVPPAIYPASYPIRFLAWRELVGVLDSAYDLVSDFRAEDPPVRAGRHAATYHGGLWRLRSRPGGLELTQVRPH